MDRNIKDAKDLGTGELIYFNSHAKATYTNDGSILEDIISSFKQDGYPVIEHGTEDTTFTLTPNALHVWGKVNTLTLTLGEETESITNEFIFIFEGSSNPVLTLPDTIKWADDVIPLIVPGKIYYISILNNLAVFSVFEGTDTQVGDICLANESGDKIFIKVGDVIPDGWTPIGVVVIPESHDVYGTGECAVISLHGMSTETPNTGNLNNESVPKIIWGPDTEISALSNFNKVPYIANNSSEQVSVTNPTIIGIADYVYLSSDNFTGSTCGHDTAAKYYGTTGKSAPSPYLTDGSRNTLYYQTSSPSTTSNALSDFNGMGNTNILTGLATAQSDWKTATSITHKSDGNYYPAACCCWRYHTTGTNQGDWYLPAFGELGYMCARLNIINETIWYLVDAGLGLDCYPITGDYYWSSSELNSTAACNLEMSMGYLEIFGKSSKANVRAFLRVK